MIAVGNLCIAAAEKVAPECVVLDRHRRTEDEWRELAKPFLEEGGQWHGPPAENHTS
jgi:hypothetical protein